MLSSSVLAKTLKEKEHSSSDTNNFKRLVMVHMADKEFPKKEFELE